MTHTSANQNQHQSSSHRPRSHHHNNHRRSSRPYMKRPNAVVFPPDPAETGSQTISRIFEAFGLSDHFPKSCHEFVQELLKKDATEDPALEDYKDKPFVTIDNDHSMDLDQAMWISRYVPEDDQMCDEGQHDAQSKNINGDQMCDQARVKDSGFRVSYALADGAFFVPAMSPLFQFALNKGGTSFYLPGKAIPMLPRKLSEDQMSLNEGVPRRALIFNIYLDQEGNVINTEYTWGVIRNRWKGSYRVTSEYYAAVDQGKSHPQAGHDYTETLDLLRQVGLLRRKLAEQRDVVNFNRDEDGFHIDIDEQNKLIFAKSQRYDSELYNEQISLLCNSEGAKILDFLDTQETIQGTTDIIHPIYRTQDSPRPEQIEILNKVIENTLKYNNLDLDQYGWNQNQMSIGAYLAQIRQIRDSQEPQSTKYRIWASVVLIIERQAMITNVAATFTPTPQEGHHSLKLTHYARFSSPMRELVGCFVHKELWEGHQGRFSTGVTTESDLILRDKVMRAAIRAKALQKKLNGAVHLHMLNQTFYKDLQRRVDNRPVYNGVLIGMDFSEKGKSRRCYVKLEQPAVEIKIYGEDMDYHYCCRFGPVGETFGRFGSCVAIAPLPGSFTYDRDDDQPPIFYAGQKVNIRVADYAQFYGQTSRSRWIFIMDTDEPELGKSPEQKKLKRIRSLVRNSVLDRDHFPGDEDESDYSADENSAFP